MGEAKRRRQARDSWPENFELLHAGEEEIRASARTVIQGSEGLRLCSVFIAEAMNVCMAFAKQHEGRHDDELTIQLLGIRLFNASSASLKMLLSGYYQVAASIQRDILETAFLLDYFQTRPDQVRRWRECSEADRKKEFSPFKIRVALDERDGFKEKKRADAYEMFCSLAAHPTVIGFSLLRKTGENLHQAGPFFDAGLVDVSMQELSRAIGQAVVVLALFIPNDDINFIETKLSFHEKASEWFERFYGTRPDRKNIRELRAILSTYRRI
ncbi:hypothetical protein [Salinarimonas soli]|uniref:Uncharacterized protein n=1 Tax=Salinarimonas soli TaxID=1638099 RepID=A0A5B2VFK8_9HYPH|nr:hypothetical protein [Salinarimonas soli]KAA2237645.1 hypothetical protein F0L46_08165 [Salinarimonas soli]